MLIRKVTSDSHCHVFRAGLSFEKDSNICLTEKRRAGTFLPFYMTWLIRRASHGEDTEKTRRRHGEGTEKAQRKYREDTEKNCGNCKIIGIYM